MDPDGQIRSAVANIKDELQRILAITEVRDLDTKFEDFRALLIQEFNKKLRELKDKNKDLTYENKQLRKRLQAYEQNSPTKARSTKSVGSIPNLQYVSPINRKRKDSGEDSEQQVMILSSPVKRPSQESSPADLAKRDLTSSQFNRLPTQYSEMELPKKLPRKLRKKDQGGPISSPIKNDFVVDDERVVANSEDEFQGLDEKEIGVPEHYTSLQRVAFLRNYYQMRLSDSKFKVNLSTNPITEKPWAPDDFRPNSAWRRPKRMESRVMTKEQERNYHEFFAQAGKGSRVEGPVWDKDDEDLQEEEVHRSQIMDKYLLPPGFMIGSFPTTQEQEEQKEYVRKRNEERVQRRLQSALAKEPGEFIFYEDVLNQYVARNQVVRDR